MIHNGVFAYIQDERGEFVTCQLSKSTQLRRPGLATIANQHWVGHLLPWLDTGTIFLRSSQGLVAHRALFEVILYLPKVSRVVYKTMVCMTI